MPLGDYGPRYVLFGIVSVGVPSCGKFSLPAVYTNVSHYLPWIYDNINWMKYANCCEQDDEDDDVIKIMFMNLLWFWIVNGNKVDVNTIWKKFDFGVLFMSWGTF
jgi:hypothetical protein